MAASGKWSMFLIWAKHAFTLGRADYQRSNEPILYGWPEGVQRYWCGARDQGDVWYVDKPICTRPLSRWRWSSARSLNRVRAATPVRIRSAARA